MAYLESHQTLAGHPKTKRAARRLGISVPQMIGHLHLLWWWAMDYAQDGDLGNYDHADLAEAAQWTDDAATFVDALVSAGFLDVADDGALAIHDWMDYAGHIIEKRKSDAARKRAARLHIDIRRTSGGHPADGAGTVPNRTVPNQTIPNHDAPTEQRTAGAVPRPDPPGEPAARDATEPTGPAGNVTHSEQEAVKDAPKGDDGREKRPPETPAVRSAPKPNKFGAVLNALKERGLDVPHTERDAGEVKRCSASPEIIANAYAAAESGAWGDDWLRANLSLAVICQRIGGYQAWKAHPPSRTNGARASPNGRRGYTAEQLAAMARGASEP